MYIIHKAGLLTYVSIYLYILYSWDSEPSTCYRHEMQFIHWNGCCGTLTFRQRDLPPPLNAPGSCASTDTGPFADHVTESIVTTDLRRGVVNLRIESRREFRDLRARN